MTIPFERACREICANCREANRMALRGEKGHTLRFRSDTAEWVHDFIKDTRKNPSGLASSSFDHRFCYATALRIKNGRKTD